MNELRSYLDQIQTQLHVLSLRRAGMSPKRDWYALLVLAIGVVIVLLGVGFFQYHLSGRVVNDDAVSGTSAPRLPDAEALKDAIGTYRERAATFETLRATPNLAPNVGAPVQVVEETIEVQDEQGTPVDDMSVEVD